MLIAPLKPEDRIYLQFHEALAASDAPRILHAACVLETDPEAGVCVRLLLELESSESSEDRRLLEHHQRAIALVAATRASEGPGKEDPDLPRIEAGQPALLYFVWNQRFSQQPGRVSQVLAEPEGLRLALMPTGRLASAESRECFRVSAIHADLWASLGPNLRCEVVDISASGFSAYVPEPLPEGSLIELTLESGDESVSGVVRVQNLRKAPGGRLRCGFHCVDDPRRNQLLLRTLPRINMALQREQLARRAGLAEGAGPIAGRFEPSRLRR